MSRNGAQFAIFDYKRANVTQIRRVFIRPGVNKMKHDLFRLIAKTNRWKYMVEHGDVVVITGHIPDNETVTDATPQVPLTLAGMSVAKVKEIISNTYDAGLLDDFETEEIGEEVESDSDDEAEAEYDGKNRKGVFDAIKKQRKLIEPAAKKGEDETSPDGDGKPDEDED